MIEDFFLTFTVIQLVFSAIKYPGVQVLPHIYFHLYSAPIWVATFANFVSIAVIIYLLEERLPKPRKGCKKCPVIMLFL